MLSCFTERLETIAVIRQGLEWMIFFHDFNIKGTKGMAFLWRIPHQSMLKTALMHHLYN